MKDYRTCDSFVRHLQSEHDRLESIASLIQSRFGKTNDEEWEEEARPELAGRLALLKDGLKRHMAEEEGGGCIEEAVSRTPSLAGEIRQIHDKSSELQEVLQQVMDHVLLNQRIKAEAIFRRFANELKRRDRHELDVVQRGMNWYPFDA
jgi:hypothetical protein